VCNSAHVSYAALPQWAPPFVCKWKEQGWDNEFTTTLHVVNSAITKLSRSQPASKVYRGSDGILPEQFWKPNDLNLRGGVESAFMSTTLSREVAFDFVGEHAPLVYEIQMGLVDGGARMQWCSHFPIEEEALFGPLTGLEVLGEPRVEGGTVVVTLRINCNVGLTIEEVTSRTRKSHVRMVQIIENELDLCFPAESLQLVKAHKVLMSQKDGKWFKSSSNFSRAT
jgi:hypothetical protein